MTDRSSSRVLRVLPLLLCCAATAAAAPGDPDPSFGVQGQVALSCCASTFAVQPDGKLLTAGLYNGRFAIARYASDGSLDTAFGVGGRTPQVDDRIEGSLGIQPDGKILVGTSRGTPPTCPTCYDGKEEFVVGRFAQNGQLDTTFGSGGITVSPITVTAADREFSSSARFEGIAVGPGGRFVLVSYEDVGTDDNYHAVAAYTADGALDSSFAGGMIVSFGIPLKLLMQADGKLVVVNTTSYINPDDWIARFNVDGSPDSSFGNDGRGAGTLVLDIGPYRDVARSVRQQADGKLVVAGGAAFFGDPPFDYYRDLALVRLESDGTFDRTFGNDGVVITRLATRPEDDEYFQNLLLQPNGKLIALAFSYPIFGPDAFLTRYLPFGSLDEAYGSNGFLVPQDVALGGILIDANGRLVTLGSAQGSPVLARFLGDPCGDGLVDPGESCDDHNAAPGDGCSAYCSVEPCFVCVGEPSNCAPSGDASPCDDANDCTTSDVCTAGSCAGSGTCDEHPIPGKLAMVKATRLVKFVAKPAVLGDDFPLPTADAVVDGGALRVFDSTGAAGHDVYDLPAGANWRGLGNPPGSSGYEYRGAGEGDDPCKIVLVKRNVLKGICRGTSVTLAPPFLGVMNITLTVAGSDRYCVQFGGHETRNDATLTKRKDAPAAGACP